MAFPWLKTGEGPPNKGKPMPLEQREKLSQAKKALVASGWKPANHGKSMSYSPEHVEKLRANLEKAVAARKIREVGDRVIYGDGYVSVYMPDHPSSNSVGYVYEHRLLGERALGRRLKRSEVVHHINGDKADNRPCNLMVCTNSFHHWFHQHMSALFQALYFGRAVT